MLSFIFCSHSSRLGDLSQTIRFLERRENLDAEVVLVCQDEFPPPPCRWPVKQVCLRSDSYNRPAMVNLGVIYASGGIVAILDSDRILPEGYFSRNSRDLSPGRVLSTRPLYRLDRPATDEEIEQQSVLRHPDPRSATNESRRKNLFAGNTLMHRRDFLDIGGWDMGYVGYGFADTDMTRTVVERGLDPVFVEEDEYHLSHPRHVIWKGRTLDLPSIRVMTATNSLRYCRKWGDVPDGSLLELYGSCFDLIRCGAVDQELADRFVQSHRDVTGR